MLECMPSPESRQAKKVLVPAFSARAGTPSALLDGTRPLCALVAPVTLVGAY